MTATILNITIEQGTDYEQPFPPIVDYAGNTVNITGATIAMQIRTTIGDPTALVTLSTMDGSLVIVSGPAGTIALPGLNAAVTAAMQEGVYVYDVLMLDSGGKRTRPFQGTATVSGEVTTISLTPSPPSPPPSPPPSDAYTGEDGITPYTAEDGTTPYNQES